jgi:hypothetical protein
MKRSAFYAALRSRTSGAFGTSLSAQQVAGMEAILAEAEHRSTPLGHLAYILGTTYHETAATMQPIHEQGKRPYFNKYEPGTRIGKVLGNSKAGNGCGRVQADDIFRGCTVGKVTSTHVIETYPDGSYLAPCTLHCG